MVQGTASTTQHGDIRATVQVRVNAPRLVLDSWSHVTVFDGQQEYTLCCDDLAFTRQVRCGTLEVKNGDILDVTLNAQKWLDGNMRLRTKPTSIAIVHRHWTADEYQQQGKDQQ